MGRRFGILVIGICLVVGMSGCARVSTPTPTIAEATFASSVGSLGMYSVAVDNSIINGVGISSSGVKASGYSTPEVGADDWWNMSYVLDYGGYTFNMTFYFKVWDKDGNLVNTISALNALTSSTLGKIWIYGTYNITYSGSSFQMSMGKSKSDPLKFEGYNTSTQTLSGPISYSGSCENKSYTVTATYNNLTVATGGYPTGTVDISVAEDSTVVCGGTLTFDGDNTATFVFTSGYSGTYTINLDTGAVTTASL